MMSSRQSGTPEMWNLLGSPQTDVRLEPIDLADVYLYGRDRYNSNNHWPNNQRPADYDQVLAQGNTSHWINQFHTNYHQFDIRPTDLRWLRPAAQIGQQTGTVSAAYFEYDQLAASSHYLIPPGDWFVRTESVSLKHGLHGKGPYRTIDQILESLVTCIPGHTPINEDTRQLTIYLLPWVTITQEFRVFVCRNRVTAISQQNLYRLDPSLAEASPTQLTSLINQLLDYYYSYIQPKITYIDGYVMDLAMTPTGPYFIELNSFGKEYAAGSALFRWLLDEDLLYGRQTGIVFRYLDRDREKLSR